ncbi:MAG TPA: hypothetical protein VF755_20045 [Catenuloplanes sp.]|jgi:hypothetical protein
MSVRPSTVSTHRLATAAAVVVAALTVTLTAPPATAAPSTRTAPSVTATPSTRTAPPAAGPPGPTLQIPHAALAATLSCGPDLDRGTGTPVLLVHGTSSTPEESWAFGYARVLPGLGHPVCTVRLPARAWGDIQVSTEYVVHAVREMAARSGRRVSVLGHSQGTVQPLWGLRFWPDLAALIDDYVALAPPLQGTVAADLVCAVPGRCPGAVWQYGADSDFVAAMNRRPLPAGPSYTAITTLFDELVVPQPAASRRAGVTTVVVQQICPGRLVEHAGLLGDAVAFAVTLDALRHPGPADPGRIRRHVCLGSFLPGIDLVRYAAAVPVFVANFAATALHAPWLTAEPPLRDYARAG